MAGGYNGKILRVNLSSGSVSVDEPDEMFYRRYVGGLGFVSYYLMKEVPANIDAFSADNKLVFAPGPITGTTIPGGARNCVGAKSPLTDGFGKAEVGGFFGSELKKAGFDAVIVEGQAENPVYLWIHDGEAEIRDASSIWGLETKESQAAIRDEHGDRLIRTAQIGPGGERMVRFACVINDCKHSAGRTGMGAVMGSKRLKAIAVRGHGQVPVADPDKVKELTRFMARNYLERARGMHDYGTGALMKASNEQGNLPVRNWADGYFEDVGKIDAMALADTIRAGMESCYACPVRCKKVVEAEKPYVIDRAYGGPEYETLASFGSYCGVDDLAAVSKAHEICGRHSLDTISMGVTIGFAMECFENGILTLQDTGGLDLRFGNAEAMVEAVELTARKEGIGELLAEGSAGAAKRLGRGAEDFAMHVKGLELPMHEPRLKQGLGLSYAVLPHGADHTAAMHDTMFSAEGPGIQGLRMFGDLDPLPIDDLGPAKVAMSRHVSHWRHFIDSMLLCSFVPWSNHEMIDVLHAVTGWDTSAMEGMLVGERIANLGRAFNVGAGKTRADDWLPKRFFTPRPSGGLTDTAVKPQELERAISTYYRQMGWTQDGVPTQEKMQEVGLSWVNEVMSLPAEEERVSAE